MKRFLTLLALIAAAIYSYAVKIDGISYTLNSTTKLATVTYNSRSSESVGSSYYYKYNTSSPYKGSVEIPEKVTYNDVEYIVNAIGANAFENCPALTSVTIPNSVTSIGNSAFAACSSLTSVEIPNSVTTIGGYAFEDCTSLESVTIPNSVTSIGDMAFYRCRSLESVTIPNSLTSISQKTFLGCSGLTSVEIPNSVTSIGSWAFEDCTSLESVTIPNSVTSIGGDAFSGCTDLSSVTLSNSLTKITAYAFEGCTSLTSIDFPNSITSIGGYAFANSGLTSLVIPNSITSIEYDAFNGCNNLTDVILPNSITTIRSGVFSGCSNLTRVTIGNAVTEIWGDAFSNCPKLKVFCCLTETAPKSRESTTPTYTKSVSLVVPKGAIDNYKKSTLWRSFGNYYCGIDDIYNVNIVDGGGQPFYGGTGTTALPVGEKLTYTRTFSEKLAGKWSALYVPISINVEDYIGEFDIAEIYAVCPNADTNGDGEINAYDENRLIINKKTTGVTKPNTPYVIRPKAAKTYTIASADNILYPTETNSLFVATSTDIYTFTGLNTTAEAIGNTQYYMTVNGVLDYSPTNPISIKPNRWLMSIESHGYGSSPSTASNAKPISISVLGEDDEATGIESISTARYNENIYNLNGVKMNEGSLPAGIYVKNGKKFVVK